MPRSTINGTAIDLDGKEMILDADQDTTITADTDDQIDFKTGGSDRVVINSSGNVGIGTTSPQSNLHVTGTAKVATGNSQGILGLGEGNGTTVNVGLWRGAANAPTSDGNFLNLGGYDGIVFAASNAAIGSQTERMRIESDGDVFIGKTVGGTATVGVEMRGDGLLLSTRDGDACSILRRNTNEGEILRFQKDSTTVASIGCTSANALYIGTPKDSDSFIRFDNTYIAPSTSDGDNRDNALDWGYSSSRWDDIYATNGTIQTSDQNEKQDIASATTKELNVAKKLSALFKTFRWKDKVAEKGDKARTHTGIIAQEIQSAFSAEGLDASNYGLFTSNTWWEKEISVDAVKADKEKDIEAKDAYTYMDIKEEKTDGYTEKTRLGVRYPELFSFIFSSIEARLTALESK